MENQEARGWIHNKDVRTYIASALFILLILALLMYLTFIPVPAGNKDLITAIISMMVGGLSVSLNKLFGKADDEADQMRAQYEAELHSMQLELTELKASFATLKMEYDRLTKMLIIRTTDVENPQFAETRPANQR